MKKHATSESIWPIKYAWEGTFRYPLKDRGHHWYYHDAASWKIWRLRSSPLAAPVPLQTTAEEILNPAAFNTIPSEYRKESYFPLLNWLVSPRKDQCVIQGLSVVLNSIVLNSTLKSFRILTTFVDAHATVQIQGLSHSEPQWFYVHDDAYPLRREEDMLVGPHIFFDLTSEGKVLKAKANFSDLAAEFKYLRVLHEYTVMQFSVTEEEIVIMMRDRVTQCSYERGKYCGSIPVPGKARDDKGTEPEAVKSPEVVVESPVVSKALAELSRVWQDRNPKKSVLISAPAGSGKEVFCSGIVYGNGRPADNLQTLSLASSDQAELERLLFGNQEGGSLRQGLIAKAANSGLFLDEVHQPESSEAGEKKHKSPVRAALLRPIEAGDYIPKGSAQAIGVDNVLFILATSKELKDLRNYDPPDFWTRVTHVVRIEHPLAIEDTEKKPDDKRIRIVLSKFFNFFWLERTRDYFMSQSGETGKLQSYSEKLLDWQIQALEAIVKEGWGAHIDSPAVVFADELFQVLENAKMKPKDCSVRGIRNMVSRLFYIAVTNLAQGERVLHEEPKVFRCDVQRVATEIIGIADLGGSK